jgi:hypothetical protein
MLSPEEKRLRTKVWKQTTEAVSQSSRYKRKGKLKLRYKHKLDEVIADTEEKLELLKELKIELNGGGSDVGTAD